MARGGGRRTYVRDGRGRFASTPGGGAPKRPPTRRASRNPGRLTRDNAGRITSIGGNGATARGGRLRTAAGNLRARQVDRLRVAPIKGAVTRAGKRRGPQREAVKPATPSARPTGRFESLGFRPGVFMSAHGRPVGVIGVPLRKPENPFGTKDQTIIKGVQTGLRWLLANGFIGGTFKQGKRKYSGQAAARMMTVFGGIQWNRDGGYALVPPSQQIQLNQASSFWKNPEKRSRENRRSGWWSTSSPVGALYHEIGHIRDPKLKQEQGRWAQGLDPWSNNYGSSGNIRKSLAKRVSQYAAHSPAEFIAETYAGLRTGHRYDHQVMRAYREAMGLPARPPARHRSRRRRKPQS